jgi:hypothetical protein
MPSTLESTGIRSSPLTPDHLSLRLGLILVLVSSGCGEDILILVGVVELLVGPLVKRLEGSVGAELRGCCGNLV